MGFFSGLFKRRSSSQPKDKNGDPSSRSLTTSTSSKSGKSNRRSSKAKKNTRTNKQHDEVEDLRIKAAKALIERYSDPELTAEKFAEIWVDDKEPRYEFEDGMSFSPADMANMLQFTRKSFPDFRMTYESIKLEGSKAVTIEGAYCKGTHTGDPYAPAPAFTPIEAKGVAVENSEERFWLEVNDTGKIITCKCYSLGNKSGPVGFYEQIGGSPIPTEETPTSPEEK